VPPWGPRLGRAGNACFTCITVESHPLQDYEVAEACDKGGVRSGKEHREDARGKVLNDQLNYLPEALR